MKNEKSKTITYAEIEQRLKNVKLEDYTYQDTIDRYVAYGSVEDFNNVEVQKLLIKYDLIEYLIYSMGTVITDSEVIKGIITSEIFQDDKYMLMRGKIESLEIKEDKNLPNGMSWLIINFIDEDVANKHKIKYIYYEKKELEYKNEISAYNKPIMAIVHKDEHNDLQLCCLLKYYSIQ